MTSNVTTNTQPHATSPLNGSQLEAMIQQQLAAAQQVYQEASQAVKPLLSEEPTHGNTVPTATTTTSAPHTAPAAPLNINQIEAQAQQVLQEATQAIQSLLKGNVTTQPAHMTFLASTVPVTGTGEFNAAGASVGGAVASQPAGFEGLTKNLSVMNDLSPLAHSDLILGGAVSQTHSDPSTAYRSIPDVSSHGGVTDMLMLHHVA